jgi:hypothetical protein
MDVFKTLPLDVVKYCLTFDQRFRIRKGEIVQRIPKNDERYSILKEKPLIYYRKEMYNNSNMYASYLDGKKITENGICSYCIVMFFYSSRNFISYYIRKIDVLTGMEMNMYRYDLHEQL